MTHFRSDHRLIVHRTHQQIRCVRRLHERIERDRTGLAYIEGMRFVARALQHQVRFEALVTCPAQVIHPFARHLVRDILRATIPFLQVSPDVFASIALAEDPQGLGVVIQQRWFALEEIHPATDACWILLDTLRSAGNLGTILRTAEAVGANGLLLLGDQVDPYDPAAVRASMGSLFSQQFVRSDVDAVRQWKKRHRIQFIGTAPSAQADYQSVDYRGATVLLLGDERKGLSSTLQGLCDHIVRIPMVGSPDSLNVSVAASLLLYEMFNQRRHTPATVVSSESSEMCPI